MKRIFLSFTIISLLFVNGSLVATEDWEKKWMDEGWVRVKYDNNKLMKFANTTWYGQVGKNQSYENRIFYIDSSGRKTFWKRREFSSVILGSMEIGENGRICFQMESGSGAEKRCNRTLWEKDGKYMVVSDIGFETGVWIIKKGNLENFK